MSTDATQLNSEGLPTEPDEGHSDPPKATPSPPTSAVSTQRGSVRTILKFAPEDEPFVVDRCTVTIALTLQPDDGHRDGRQVLIGVRSHNEVPLIGIARLNELQLPGEIVTLLEKYELELPARGQAQAEKLAQEEARRQADEAKRKARATPKSKSAKSEGMPTLQPSLPPALPAEEPSPEITPLPAPQISLFS